MKTILQYIDTLKKNLKIKVKNKNHTIIRQGMPECFTGLPLYVNWTLTSNCNYRCSYCFDAGSGYEKVFCTLEQAETAIRHLASANRPSYSVSLLGGEPTTHPHLAEIVSLLHQHLGDRLKKVTNITNGSFSERQIETLLEVSAASNCILQLIVSVHLEFAGIERIVGLVKRLSNQVRLNFFLMLPPGLFDKAKSMADALTELRREYPFDLNIKMLREPPFDKIDSRYTQAHFDWADEARKKYGDSVASEPKFEESGGNKMRWEFLVERKDGDAIRLYEPVSELELGSLTDSFSFGGMTCCAGTNIVRIEIDGKASGFVCRLAHKVCNIFEENPFEREDWMHGVYCTNDRCGCPANCLIPKFRDAKAAKRFIAEKRQEQKQLMQEYKEKR